MMGIYLSIYPLYRSLCLTESVLISRFMEPVVCGGGEERDVLVAEGAEVGVFVAVVVMVFGKII